MNQIDYLRLLCGAASGIICVHDTNGNITTSPCDVDSIVSAYDRAVAERDELLKTLRDVDAMADRNAGLLTQPMRLYIGDVLRALAQQKPKEEGR